MLVSLMCKIFLQRLFAVSLRAERHILLRPHISFNYITEQRNTRFLSFRSFIRSFFLTCFFSCNTSFSIFVISTCSVCTVYTHTLSLHTPAKLKCFCFVVFNFTCQDLESSSHLSSGHTLALWMLN